MWYCYILKCIDEDHPNLTYNGSTNNIIRRLNQHNGVLKGGAKSTSGKKWEIYAIMTGFTTHNEALSCEWRIKHPTGTKRRPSKYCGVNGRILGLNELFGLDKWTTKCVTNISDGNYKLYISKNNINNLNKEIIPDNIELSEIDEFNETFLSSLQN